MIFLCWWFYCDWLTPQAMAKVLEDHHGYLRKVAERSTNFLICYLAPPCLKHCGCWHLLTYLLRFGPMLLGFQDGRRNFPEEVCRCDLVHQGQRSEEDRGATYTNSYTHICIYLQKCIHMFSHISCGQVFLTIYTNKYIYIYIFVYCRCMQIDFKKSIGNLGFKP